MVEIKILEGKAIFEVDGWDKLWALKSRLEIPLEHIKGVNADTNPAMDWFNGLKVYGTSIPHIFRAGTFYQEGNMVFWDVHNPQNTIVIELEHEYFSKLIIEVAEPTTSVDLLKKMIREAK